MKEIDVRVDVTPIPKGRPRFSTRGGFPRAYTPAKTKQYETQLNAAFIYEMLKAGIRPLSGPVRLSVSFYLKKPKSYPTRIKHSIKKPDLDNLVKSVLDAANSVLFNDDAQIVELKARKLFIEDSGYILVKAEELPDDYLTN